MLAGGRGENAGLKVLADNFYTNLNYMSKNLKVFIISYNDEDENINLISASTEIDIFKPLKDVIMQLNETPGRQYHAKIVKRMFSPIEAKQYIIALLYSIMENIDDNPIEKEKMLKNLAEINVKKIEFHKGTET